ncbi:MAG: hypothetical protein R3257_07565, partial [bacterium]|nr:hypothetical protein [bacterium]
FGEGGEPLGFSVLYGLLRSPKVQARPKRFTFLRQVEDFSTDIRIMLEQGSMHHPMLEPQRARMEVLQGVLTRAVGRNAYLLSDDFKCLLAKVINRNPVLLSELKRNLAGEGHYLWVGMNVDEPRLEGMVVLDGGERPHRVLLPGPLGKKVYELEIFYDASGFPMVLGKEWALFSTSHDSIRARPLDTVKYDEFPASQLWESKVLRQLGERKAFTIQLGWNGGSEILIRYARGKNKSSWSFLEEGQEPLLDIETGYEEFSPPSIRGSQKRGKSRKGARQQNKKVESPRLEWFQKLSQDFLAQIREKASKGEGDVARILAGAFKRMRRMDVSQMNQVYSELGNRVELFLRIPYHGPSFLAQFASLLNPPRQTQIAQSLLIHLGNPIYAATSFDSLRSIWPILDSEQIFQLGEKFNGLYGSGPGPRGEAILIDQVRRMIREGPREEAFPEPTFFGKGS